MTKLYNLYPELILGYMNQSISILLAALLLVCCNPKNVEISEDYHTWGVYRGDPGSNAYSALDQINKQNVGLLELAWTYSTNDKSVSASRASIQCNPIIINDILYGTSATLKAFALNAATGEQIWQFDPENIDGLEGVTGNNRGLTYWAKECDKRLFYAIENKLIALDATTGNVITDFGEAGMVDLRQGLDRDFDENSFITSTSPGIIYQKSDYHGFQPPRKLRVLTRPY